jgi:hypothetical protein
MASYELEGLPLPKKTRNYLYREEIFTLDQFKKLTASRLRKIHGVGDVMIAEILTVQRNLLRTQSPLESGIPLDLKIRRWRRIADLDARTGTPVGNALRAAIAEIERLVVIFEDADLEWK